VNIVDRKTKNWNFWRQQAFTTGEQLTVAFAKNGLPVTLKPIATARRVRNVVFRPLLVDGCLSVKRDGFNIYVRCSKEEVEETTKRFSEGADPILPGRMRFTIAHEIAHTFFFDLSSERPRNRLATEHPGNLKALERVCNQTAARLLLPTDLMRREFTRIDVFKPEALRALARRAGVSGSMLANRLGELSPFIHDVVAVAYVEIVDGVAKITGLGIPAQLKGLFAGVRAGFPFSQFIVADGLAVNQGSALEKVVDVPFETSFNKGIQQFHVRCESFSSRTNGAGYFVTAHQYQQPRYLKSPSVNSNNTP
jgi:hypothetical protein